MQEPGTGRLRRGAVVAAACLVGATPLGQVTADDGAAPPHASAGAATAPISVTVADPIVLTREAPIVVAYTDSPKLTGMLRQALAAEGFRVSDRVDPETVLVRMRGVLQLTGKHTARIPVAALAERGTAASAADAHRALAPADVGYVIAAGHRITRLVGAGELGTPAGGVLLLDVVGQATGAKDWFNKAIGGDRRGICLVNCEHWHKTRQSALHVVEVETGPERRRMAVKAEVLAEALQPGTVVSAGLAALVAALSGKSASGEPEPETRDGNVAN